MSDDIQKLVEFMQGYARAVSSGVNAFAKALPVLINQDIKNRANKKLDTTKADFLSAVSVKLNEHVLVVELDKDNWVANAVESGVGQFDMKRGLLSSPKAKRSEKGYRYMFVPIGKKKDGKPADNDKSREYQKRINEVLAKPIFGNRVMSQHQDGRVFERQEVLTNDPLVKGLYRTRQWESAKQLFSGGMKPAWQYVLFRTVSDNPLSKADWKHPGIQPVHIFRDTEQWLNSNAENLLVSFIEDQMKAINLK
jgi:hypothetical protein